jgi:transposase
LILTDEERDQLSRWTRRRKSSQALALRSRIVLACAEGMTNKDVAALVGCSAPTVTKWRSRFVDQRLDGLSDDPRPGRPATISTDQVEGIVVATLESTPENATHVVPFQDGRRQRVVQVHRRADLEGLWPRAPPH